MDRTLADRDRANRLFDAYGALLTARQRRLVRRYYQDDLSLGEIAVQMRISRQAVHDGLRRALAALERYEAALGLARRSPVPAGPAGGADGTEPAMQPAAGGHYFATTPRSPRRPRRLQVLLRGRTWDLDTAGGVFARRGLDEGTRLLIKAMTIGRADRVLDLGCGYGPIGLVAAWLAPRGRALLVDTNRRAAALALGNAAANGLTNVHVLVADGAGAVGEGTMDVVATNPPIRAGRRVVRGFVADAWRVLRPGGRLFLVARTAQGAKTLASLVAAQFGDARQVRASAGYRIYTATKAEGPRAGTADV